MLQNKRKASFSCFWLTLRKKTRFCKYFPNFSGLIKNCCLNNPNFPQDLHLSNTLKKKFLRISVLLSEKVSFLTNKRSSLWISQKNASKQQKSIVQLYVDFEEKNKFLYIFPTFNWFDQKCLFKQIQISLRICHSSNLLRKTNAFLCSFLRY